MNMQPEYISELYKRLIRIVNWRKELHEATGIAEWQITSFFQLKDNTYINPERKRGLITAAENLLLEVGEAIKIS